MGLVETDKVADRITLLKEPETWDFGPAVAELKLKLKYAFHRVADEMDSDFEETFLGNWTLGYESQDVLVAVMHLMDSGVIASYDVKDTEKGGAVNTYTFYSLVENADKHWGLNTFKKPPVPGLVEEPKVAEVVPAPIPDAPVDTITPVGEQGAVKVTDNPETQNEVEPVNTAEEPQNEQPAN